MPAISAVIITLNEAANLGRCLASLEGVADEVLVVDSGSTDETQAIAQQHGARFMAVTWQGYAATKNQANQAAQHPYILSLDADEELSPELRASVLAAKPDLRGAYRFARLTRFGSHWVRYGGWYPDHKVRLFPRDGCRWEGEYVHETLALPPNTPVSQLAGDLLHHSFASVSDYWHRVDGYTTLAAQELFQRGKRSHWLKLWLKPAWSFFRSYWLKQGFRDGRTGWAIAHLTATYQRVKYLKLAELAEQELHGPVKGKKS